MGRLGTGEGSVEVGLGDTSEVRSVRRGWRGEGRVPRAVRQECFICNLPFQSPSLPGDSGTCGFASEFRK